MEKKQDFKNKFEKNDTVNLSLSDLEKEGILNNNSEGKNTLKELLNGADKDPSTILLASDIVNVKKIHLKPFSNGEFLIG